MSTIDSIPSELGVVRGDWRFFASLESNRYINNLFLRTKSLHTFKMETKQWTLYNERDINSAQLFSIHPSIFCSSSRSINSKRFTPDSRVWVGKYPRFTSDSKLKHEFTLHLTDDLLADILEKWQYVEKTVVDYEIETPKIEEYFPAV